MDHAQAKAAIEVYLANNWTATPIYFDNVSANPSLPVSEQSIREWVRCSIIFGRGRQATLGASPEYSVTGVAMFQIFIEKDSGSGRAMNLASQIITMVKDSGIDEIMFGDFDTPPVGPTGGWYQLNAIVNFRFRR